MKRRVYFNEFNTCMHNTAYLPLVSGLLRAYAETSELLKNNYEFMPFLFYRDVPEKIIGAYENPSVAAFSVSGWNEQLNLEVARRVKELYPDCLIVFGGPQVPHDSAGYFRQFPFVDVAVRGDGEETFSDILGRFLESRNFEGIPGISWRHPGTGACVSNEGQRELSRDLDIYPSPYLLGLYEDLFSAGSGMKFQAIIETNRGCPFLCTFCFWGQGGLSRKYRFFSMERVQKEVEWLALHKISYVFNADSNFGMHRRDMDIAQILVETKKQHGYPDRFYSCYGKNTDDKIYNVAKLLNDHGLNRGIRLSRQSNDEEVLKNIKRDNIKMSTYANLQSRFNEDNLPTYTDLILGLPGETFDTWVNGIEELMASGFRGDLIIYLCQVLPNTDLADPDYLKQFGIVSRRIELSEIHGSPHESGLTPEYEEIVISTKAMPLEDWRRAMRFSWLIQLFHTMRLFSFVLHYLNRRLGVPYVDFARYLSEGSIPDETGKLLRREMDYYDGYLDNLLKGHGRGHLLPEFGNIYFDAEDATYLRISDKFETFYDELLGLLGLFLIEKSIPFDDAELYEAVQYQRMRTPAYPGPTLTSRLFHYNFPEYFETCYHRNPRPLEAFPQIMELVNPQNHEGGKQEYARKTVLAWSSEASLNPVRWYNVPVSHSLPQAI